MCAHTMHMHIHIGNDDWPCRSLEDAPEDVEKYCPPRMCAEPKGQYIYLLTSEYGLIKMGTGQGERRV